MCGIGAILHKNPNININKFLYEILFNLQHRGQHSSGFIIYDTLNHINTINKQLGLVENNLTALSNSNGNVGIGHVRYPTQGSTSQNEIQPFYSNEFNGISLCHNGNITNTKCIKNILSNKMLPITTSDSELLLQYFIYLLKQYISNISELNNDIIKNIVKNIYDNVKGSYSIIIKINSYGLITFRDIYGIRPLVYNISNDFIEIASETIALKESENYINVKNGEVIIIKSLDDIENIQIYNYPLKPCLFEYIYFARPESYINDILVYEYREKSMEKLLNIITNNINADDIDCVIPVPQTGIISGIKIAQLLNKPIKQAIIKNRYTHRTFIENGDNIIKGIKKIKIIKKLVYNKNVLIVDDSIVRGNTSKYIINELKKNGVRNIYFKSCCQPIKYPNIYGISIQTYNELIANNKTVENIEKELGVKKLIFLNLNYLSETLLEINSNLNEFEDSVFTGNYLT